MFDFGILKLTRSFGRWVISFRDGKIRSLSAEGVLRVVR